MVEKTGAIRIVKDGTTLATPFLDLTLLLPASPGFEQGLQSMAFPLDHAASGRFYVFFTTATGNIEVDEFRISADPNVADAAMAPGAGHRSLGHADPLRRPARLRPDGMLWIATGDGGLSGDSSGNSQNSAIRLGKVLRVDPRAGPALAPPDTPFVAGGGEPRYGRGGSETRIASRLIVLRATWWWATWGISRWTKSTLSAAPTDWAEV